MIKKAITDSMALSLRNTSHMWTGDKSQRSRNQGLKMSDLIGVCDVEKDTKRDRVVNTSICACLLKIKEQIIDRHRWSNTCSDDYHMCGECNKRVRKIFRDRVMLKCKLLKN